MPKDLWTLYVKCNGEETLNFTSEFLSTVKGASVEASISEHSSKGLLKNDDFSNDQLLAALENLTDPILRKRIQALLTKRINALLARY